MSEIYDNWERLIDAVLRREHDRELAYADSTSFSSSTTSHLTFRDSDCRDVDISVVYVPRAQLPMDHSDLTMSDLEWKSMLEPHKQELVYKSAGMSFFLKPDTGKNCFLLGVNGIVIQGNWEAKTHPKSRFSEVAELKGSESYEIVGAINTKSLSPDTSYAAYLVFEFAADNVTVNAACFYYGYWITIEVGNGKRRSDAWTEIQLPHFFVGSEVKVLVDLSVSQTGLVVEGIEFRPAAAAAPNWGKRKCRLSGFIITSNLKIFTLSELKTATRNFIPDLVLGEDRSGRVYKGSLDAPSPDGVGMLVAVKTYGVVDEQDLQWQAEVKFLGKISHPNLVKLLGYCWEDRQFLLVFEYMQKGSLESHLFQREPIPWETRMRIAIGAARGLALLHTNQIIFGVFKASNILLDGEFNAKLSDFGLANLSPIDENPLFITETAGGTSGYAAPEYIATGQLSVKSDVYSFGVVLLELMTGGRVLDRIRPYAQSNLVEWAVPSLRNKRKWKMLIDPRLMGRYPSKAAHSIVKVIINCLKVDPRKRPSTEDILNII